MSAAERCLLALILVGMCDGCATLWAPPATEFCGMVGPVAVRADKWNARIHCPEALDLTARAYSLARPLSSPWDLEFTYTFLEFVDGYRGTLTAGTPGNLPSGDGPTMADGITRADHTIQVRETRPSAVLHELTHAWLFEHGWTGTQHDEMCRRGWYCE
jgi:hypothetical protein